MYKKIRKSFALGLTLTMLLTIVGFTSVVSAATVPSSQVTTIGRVTRIAGHDRYVTATTVATTPVGTTSNNVVLVSGGNYADAISATTLAKHLNAPILLTNQGAQTLNPDTKTALATLKAKNVYIVGGTGVITSAVRTTLRSSGYVLVQLGGLTRYATNVMVANELITLGVSATNVMMVGGENFPDALSAAPIAANKDEILLLANTDVTSSKATIDFANNHKSSVTIIGDSGLVSYSVQAAIKNVALRITGGATRYDTNKIILNAYAKDLKFDKIYVASGEDYPDALVASPLAGNVGGPLLLVNTNATSSTSKPSMDFAVNYIKVNATDATKIYIIGGSDVVSDTLVTAINLALSPIIVKATTVSLNKTIDTLIVGGTDNLIATVNPTDVTNKDVTWTSSDNTIATVDNTGKITAIGAGTATITVTTVDGSKIATCNITVNNPVVTVTSVSLNKTSDTLTVGNVDNLTPTITPNNSTNQAVTWTSSDVSIATVDNTGKITAIGAGTATITVTTVDRSKIDTCNVTVNNPVVTVTSVSLNKTSDTLTVGDVDNLTSTITPNNATNQAVTWMSSDVSIATVDNTGKISAIGAGTATITATTVDGNKTGTCIVTVNNPVINVTSVGLNKTTDTLIVGSTDTLSATVAPSNATNQAVTWTSSDNTIATVDNTGKITAVSAGTVTIAATTVDGNNTASCTVTVTVTINNPVVTFADANLGKIVRRAVNKPTGDIYESDVENITTLKAENLNINNLSGIENLRNLQSLDLDDNQISDISALKELTNLTYLDLGYNKISDISALNGLTNLTSLYLSGNQISDISALSELTNLTLLSLGSNQISDISALNGLTNLTWLDLGSNQISDISALSRLTNLTSLGLENNKISDVSSLEGLINLYSLYLTGNTVSSADEQLLETTLLMCNIYM